MLMPVDEADYPVLKLRDLPAQAMACPAARRTQAPRRPRSTRTGASAESEENAMPPPFVRRFWLVEDHGGPYSIDARTRVGLPYRADHPTRARPFWNAADDRRSCRTAGQGAIIIGIFTMPAVQQTYSRLSMPPRMNTYASPPRLGMRASAADRSLNLVGCARQR